MIWTKKRGRRSRTKYNWLTWFFVIPLLFTLLILLWWLSSFFWNKTIWAFGLNFLSNGKRKLLGDYEGTKTVVWLVNRFWGGNPSFNVVVNP